MYFFNIISLRQFYKKKKRPKLQRKKFKFADKKERKKLVFESRAQWKNDSNY